jgi:hypothetical protein
MSGELKKSRYVASAGALAYGALLGFCDLYALRTWKFWALMSAFVVYGELREYFAPGKGKHA